MPPAPVVLWGANSHHIQARYVDLKCGCSIQHRLGRGIGLRNQVVTPLQIVALEDQVTMRGFKLAMSCSSLCSRHGYSRTRHPGPKAAQSILTANGEPSGRRAWLYPVDKSTESACASPLQSSWSLTELHMYNSKPHRAVGSPIQSGRGGNRAGRDGLRPGTNCIQACRAGPYAASG